MSASSIAYRLEVLETFLKAAVPLLKIDKFRNLLERDRHRLTASSHMRNYLPDLVIRYIGGLKSDISKSSLFAVIFDGTSHDGEILVILVRYWDPLRKKFVQKLIKLRVSDLSLNGDELGVVILEALQRVGIQVLNVVGFIHDAASVNFSAVTALSRLNTRNAVDLACWSHIFSRVGKRLELPAAISFVKTASNLFSKSVKVPILLYLFKPLIFLSSLRCPLNGALSML